MITLINQLLIEPLSHGYVLRALATCLILGIGCAPLGCFLMLRRMTLVGDAMSHAILPGVAGAFLLFGMQVWPMTLGAFIAGLGIATAAILLTRYAKLKEDSGFALVFLMSLAGGTIMISSHGDSDELVHVLFGDVFSIGRDALMLAAAAACLSIGTLSVIYRGLVIECFDPDFMKSVRKGPSITRLMFFLLLVVNLVAAFQALGSLMALGLMILPAIAARFWTHDIDHMVPLSVLIAAIAVFAGILTAYHSQIPAGPAVVLAAGVVTLLSVLCGRLGSVRNYIFD